jgi:HAD superfamily hydrolase (TIGR01509 family)
LSTYNLQLGLPGEIAHSKQARRWLHYYWAQSAELLSDREKYAEDEELFWINHSRRYLVSSGCQSEQAAELAPSLTECMRDCYQPIDTLADQAEDILLNLQEHEFRLAVISNRTLPFDEQLETLGISSYFEYALAAGTIDAWKPDPKIFQHALIEMKIKPEQAVYVGDNYFADVVGARSAGIEPILIDPEGLFPEADCIVLDNIGEIEISLSE